MKKLLLMALMALGTSAFAAEIVPMGQQPGETEATLPVAVKGVIVDNTGYQLVITPTLSAGPGAGLEYDFGDLMTGTSTVAKNGKYKVELLKDGNPAKFVKDPTIKLVGGTGAQDNIKDVDTQDGAGQLLAKIHYENTVAKSGEAFEGSLVVSADPSQAVGKGVFMTNAVGVNVSATNQNDAGEIK